MDVLKVAPYALEHCAEYIVAVIGIGDVLVGEIEKLSVVQSEYFVKGFLVSHLGVNNWVCSYKDRK